MDAFQYWLDQLKPAPLQTVDHPLLVEKAIELKILRTDLVHPIISGNKSYKLKYNLKAALNQAAAGVLSFGGAWSNHLHALAYSCYLLQRPCVAVIRGEPELIAKSAMLQDIQNWGTTLHFVTRKDYRLRDESEWLAQLAVQYPNYYCVPEGGSSALAQPGVITLAQQLEQACTEQHWQPNQVWCAVGTGGTLAGLIAGRTGNYQIIGVPVLKGAEFLYRVIKERLSADQKKSTRLENRWQLQLEGHFGGYGKVSPWLLDNIEELQNQLFCSCPDNALLLDPVYTGKLFSHFWQKLEAGDITPNSRVILVHSGGLQGRRGYGLDMAR